MSKKGIDVSKYQREIDWGKVKNSGIEFAVIRAGYGRESSQEDPYFKKNYEGAKAVGLPIGTYWYSYAMSVEEAKLEASVCLEILKDKGFDLPVYYDVEEGKQAELGRGTVTDMVLAFSDKIKAAGHQAGVYASANWLKNYLDLSRLDGLSIWKADYREDYDKEIFCDIHQYTSQGRVDGIDGNVDLNHGYMELPKPEPETKKVDVYYRVRTQAHGWLSEVKNLEDYAGWKDSPVTDFAMRVSEGSVKYRVHVKGGNWLPYVTGYDINESKNGYAGNGKPIDAIEIYYNTPDTIRPYQKAKYRVAPLGGAYYSWQFDDEKSNGQDGYAGVFGREIGKVQVTIE